MTGRQTRRAGSKRVLVANPPNNFNVGTALSRGSRVLIQSDGDYNRFLAALEPWVRTDDIKPLLGFIRSDQPLTKNMRRDMAGLIELLDERTRPRPQGKPGGKQLLYRNPNHWAAYIARGLIRGWKAENNRPRIPAGVKESIVAEAIECVRTWKVAQEFKGHVDTETVLDIMRKSRRRSF